MGLDIIYQNVRGLNTRLDYFRQNLLALDCNIVAVTESWLTDAVNDAELAIGGWSVLRRDRASGARGGGVLLAARPGIELRRRTDLETLSGEDLWVTFVASQMVFHVCVVYIPPSASEDTYMQWFGKVESVIDTLRGIVLVIGDLNLNPAYTSQSVLSYYSYFLSVCGLNEMNEVRNVHGSRLDVVLVSERIADVMVSELAGVGLVPRIDAYHPPLEISVPLHGCVSRPTLERLDPSNVDVCRDWNFAKGDFELMYKLVSEVSWQDVLSASDVDIAVDAFYNVLYGIFDHCVPKRKRPSSSSRRYPVWFTAELIYDIKRKSDLHREWKATRDEVVYERFAMLRSKVKKHLALAYDNYIGRIQSTVKTDPRTFWQHVGSLKTDGGFVSRIKYKDEQFVGREVASAFANYFSEVFLPDIPLLEPGLLKNADADPKPGVNCIDIKFVTLLEVEAGIKRLKANSSVGPDNLPAYVVKGCMEFLKIPIQYIFNLALSSGSYPRIWKMSRVRPVPKAGDTSVVEGYRPIAVLSTLGKLFETVLHRNLSLQVRPFLCDAQHGFRSGRSVTTNLLLLTDYIAMHLDRGIQVDVLYFDFAKAFDRVDNDVLLGKLDKIGFSHKLLTFFASYLRDRQQFVRHGCFVSAPYHTRSGVSQGSILGPLFFGIMINDLKSVLQAAQCLLYADDLKLVYRVEREADCGALQRDIDSVFRWSEENKLYFNLAKCCVCTFSRSRAAICAQYALGNEPINRVFSVKDLGVVFDARLTFHEHISSLAMSCFRRLGFVIRNVRHFCDPVAIKMVYNALVRSKLETSSIVWNPYESTYVLLLEKVQKVFLRFLYKKVFGFYPYLYPTKYLLGSLGYNSLEVRRNYQLVVMACRALRGDLDCPEIVERLVRLFVPDIPRIALRPRRRDLLAVPSARTVSCRNSPLLRALAQLNALLASTPECDLFAWRWAAVRCECLRFCEAMDDRCSTVPI